MFWYQTLIFCYERFIRLAKLRRPWIWYRFSHNIYDILQEKYDFFAMVNIFFIILYRIFFWQSQLELINLVLDGCKECVNLNTEGWWSLPTSAQWVRLCESWPKFKFSEFHEMFKNLFEGQKKFPRRTKMLDLWLFRFVPGTGKQTERFISNGSEGTVYANTVSYFVNYFWGLTI